MRRAPRVEVDLPVLVTAHGFACLASIRNLSLTGLFVHLENTPISSPLVNLHFVVGPDDLSLEVLSRIVRSTLDGFGAEFLDLGHEARDRFWKFLVQCLPVTDACPFCGRILPGNSRAICAHCRRCLDFQGPGFQEVLVSSESSCPSEMIGFCPAMHRVFELIPRLAATDLPILITGAQGTGKETLARAIHLQSHYRDGPFTIVHCGAQPSEWQESVLFCEEPRLVNQGWLGHDDPLTQAQGGTLYLAEVGELSWQRQSDLLLFLKKHVLGSLVDNGRCPLNFRLITATNVPLIELISVNRFREDLSYWLGTARIDLPLLRDRQEDLLILASIFLKQAACQFSKKILGFSRPSCHSLQTYAWPGNIEELRNRIQRAALLAEGPWVEPHDLGLPLHLVPPNSPPSQTH